MAFGKLRKVWNIELPMIPEDAVGVIISYEIDPPTGSALVYRAPGDTHPIELPGPKGIALVPIISQEIYLQRIKGAIGFKALTVEGYSDDQADFTSEEMRQSLLDRIKQRRDRWPLV